jgi:hypothetical protein
MVARRNGFAGFGFRPALRPFRHFANSPRIPALATGRPFCETPGFVKWALGCSNCIVEA